MLLALLVLLAAGIVLVLVVNPPGSPRRNAYLGLIFGLGILLALAYGANRAGRYYPAAGLTVAAAVLGPWGSVLLDPGVLRGDFVPLTYAAIPILLSGMLLLPVVTAVLAGLQLAALALLSVLNPYAVDMNWPSFLAFFVFLSALSIIASVIGQRDLEQIDRQTRLLVLREAELREDSIRDELTGLFDRRYMDETLEREVQRAGRKNYPLGIIMMDIDHFKHFNDTMGHAVGDRVLQELGGLLRRQVRLGDVACRYGGEEFVLLLPDASLEVTRERAERLRKQVKRLRLEHGGLGVGTITVSLGVAAFPDHGSTGEALLKSADDALYRAKREGRDRVVVADPMITGSGGPKSWSGS